MSCIPCIVFPTSTNNWMAQLESGSAGPFLDRDLALRVAVIEALRLRRLNKPARVVIIAEEGAVKAERCLCQAFNR